MAKKTEKKTKKAEQLKIAGTERKDRIPEIDDADETYREKRDARMEYFAEEQEAQTDLTNVMQQHGITKYRYEGKDGKMHEVYLPDEIKAKSRTVKEPKAPKAAE